MSKDTTMSQQQVYQWRAEIARHMPHLGSWQVRGLALLSLGVIWAERSTLTKIAEKLASLGKPDSLERRFQRWISNYRIAIDECQRAWVRWVIGAFDDTHLVLLVDETKLGLHLSVMMVGVAYRQRCIPLVWRCYHRHDGQVELIKALLQVIAEAVDFAYPPLVQADRGIGTSPALCRAVQALGWRYLFRVQNHSKFLTRKQQYVALDRVVHKPGQQWSGQGIVFKKRGQVRAHVHVLWGQGQTEPWCLVSNDPLVVGDWYAMRVWQEESFRDLKSGGWQWHRSRVWQPDHADRLILVLALAYAWTLTHGTLVMASPELLRQVTRGTRKRFSVFRCGLRFLSARLARQEPVWPGLFFAPAIRLC
jgi:hypothetical protein